MERKQKQGSCTSILNWLETEKSKWLKIDRRFLEEHRSKKYVPSVEDNYINEILLVVLGTIDWQTVREAGKTNK